MKNSIFALKVHLLAFSLPKLNSSKGSEILSGLVQVEDKQRSKMLSELVQTRTKQREQVLNRSISRLVPVPLNIDSLQRSKILNNKTVQLHTSQKTKTSLQLKNETRSENETGIGAETSDRITDEIKSTKMKKQGLL